MGLKHAVRLTNKTSGKGKAGAFVGCSDMTFIIAFYDGHANEVRDVVDRRVGLWKEEEAKVVYEHRIGQSLDLSFDIYSMLFVTTFHPEYVNALSENKV